MKIHRYFDVIKYNLEYLCSHKKMFGTTIAEYYSYLIMFPCLSLQTSKMSSRNLNYIRLSYNMSHICQLIEIMWIDYPVSLHLCYINLRLCSIFRMCSLKFKVIKSLVY